MEKIVSTELSRLIAIAEATEHFEAVHYALLHASIHSMQSLVRIPILLSSWPYEWSYIHARFAARYFQWLCAVEEATGSTLAVGVPQSAITEVMIKRSLALYK